MNRKNAAFILITLGVFIILFFSKVFQHGLFFDGLIYSSLSNNLANGIGSFWEPHFSETIYPAFYEHPPLVFGMESIFMNLFDGAFFSEKLFSFLMACLTVLFMVLIWRKVVPGKELKQLLWLPVLFWIITPKNSWSFNNNLLENTMGVFSLGSVYLLLISLQLRGFKKHVTIGCTAILLLLAFMSKGFPGLFPLGFFFLYMLFFKQNYTFRKFLKDTGILVLFTGGVSFLFFFFNEAAQSNIGAYIETQVFGSITGKSRVGSRPVLMKNLFNELIPLLIISAIVFGVYRRKAIDLIKGNLVLGKWALLFVVIGLSASVPLMVSPKISSFYLIPTLPYFTMAFAFILSPMILEFTKKVTASKLGFGITGFLGITAVIIGVTLTIVNTNTVGRNHDIFNDMDQLELVLEPHTTVSIHTKYHADWTTIAYLQRYLNVSVDRGAILREYYLIPVNSAVPQDYEKIDLATEKFDLVKAITVQ